jgi:tetratricopeptide (TPR) repeat protein
MAKQVNKPFLIVLVIVILALVGGGVFVAKHPWWKHTPKVADLMAQGEAAMTDKKYDEAVGKFAMAWSLAPSRPDCLTRMGDALYQLAKVDPENAQKAMYQWNQALQLDPTYVPALMSKMNAYIDEMEANPRAEIYVRVRDSAAQLAKIDPGNTRAAAYQYIATLSGWYNNVQTDPAKVTEAVEGLKSLTKSDSANADLPWHIARALIQYGQEAGRARHTDEALARYGEAQQVMEKAVADQPGNALMLLRTGQIYNLLDITVPRDISKGEYEKACSVYFDRARDLAKPEDPNYQEIQTVYAGHKLATGDRATAERVYRDLLRRKPDDVALQLVLAEVLQASRDTRKEAAEMLANTVAQGELPTASKAPMARRLQARAIVRLASVRMDLLEDVRDDTNRRDLLAQIEADVAKAEARMAENPETLKIRGRLLLIKGDRVRALQVLSKAASMLEGAQAQADYDLMYSLARAHLAAENNGEARRLLEIIVRNNPTFLPARLLLVDLLLNSNETVEAAKHIDELEKQIPDSALVARFRIFTLDPKKDRAQIDQYYARLPEGSRPDKLEKARIAIVIDKLKDGARLLEMVRAATPNDARVADRLARLYIGMGDRDKAKQVIDDTLKLVPNDATLMLLRDRMNNATPEDLMTVAAELIEKTADPLLRTLQKADLERLRGNASGMYAQLIEAEKIAPNDPRVQDSLFTYYLATRQWDAAYKYIDPLAKSNFGGSYGLIYWWKYFAAKGDYAQAVNIGNQFTQKMPEFAVSWITLGQAHKMRGDYSEALAAFNSALERQKANRDAMRGAIDCLYALGRYSEAKKIIDDAVKLYPLDLGLQEMLVEYELKYGDPRNVMSKLLGNVEREPNQLAHYLNAASMYYHLATKPGTSPEAAADWQKKGVDMLKSAVEHFPDTPAAYVALADAQSLAKQRDAGEATLKAMVNHPKLKDMAEPKLILAEFYIKGGEPAKAEQFLRDALALAPKSQEIRRKLAVFLAKAKRVDDALNLLNDAGPQAQEPMLMTCRMEILSGANRYAEVETIATQALQAKPDDPGLLSILANAQFSQGHYDAAIATSDKVLAKDPKNSRALIARGMAKMRKPNADPADAINDLVAYRDLNPNDPQVRVLLAEVYNRKQRFADAMVELQTALGLTPNDMQLRASLLEAYRLAQPMRAAEGDQLVKDAQAMDALMSSPEWLVAESTWMVARKQYQRAADDAKKATTLSKDNKYLQHYLGVLLNTKHESDLLTESEAMLRTDSKRWWVYQARGLAKKALHDPTAGEEFDKAVNTALDLKDPEAVDVSLRTMAREVSPDRSLGMILPHVNENPRYPLVAAQLYLQKGDETSAVKIVDQAMADRTKPGVSPGMNAATLAYGGAVYCTVHPAQTDKAIAAYQELIKLQPDNVEALNQLAWLLVSSNPSREKEALQYSARAYQLVSNSGRFSSAVFDTHGWALVLCGKLDEGVDLLQLVVDKYATVDAHWHLSQAYQKQGKTSEAAAQLQKAQDLIKFQDDNKIPVDPDLRQKIRDAAARASATTP